MNYLIYSFCMVTVNFLGIYFLMLVTKKSEYKPNKDLIKLSSPFEVLLNISDSSVVSQHDDSFKQPHSFKCFTIICVNRSLL